MNEETRREIHEEELENVSGGCDDDPDGVISSGLLGMPEEALIRDEAMLIIPIA